jgi:hypothetical protein
MWDHGRALIALATWLRLEPSEEVAATARHMVEGLAAIALREQDYWYYPAENWTGVGWGDTVLAHPPTGLAIEGLVDLAQLMGDDSLLEIAAEFAHAVTRREPLLFAEDGTMIPMGGGPYDFAFTHLHSRLTILIGLVKYALCTQDTALLEWCVSAYRFAKGDLSSSFGWVPESLESGTDDGVRDLSARRRDEVCSISDMMQLAALLAENGYPEERAVIGRYGTNQLFVHQLVDLSPLEHLIGDGSGLRDTKQTSYRGMPERCLGGFTAGTYPNDIAVDLRSFGMSAQQVDAAGCCSPAGIKALYVMWHEAAQREGADLHIRLWVSTENGDARVECDEPRAGRLCVVAKRPCDDLVVHIPDYVEEVEAPGEPSRRTQGGDIHFGPMRAGDRVALRYPLVERTRSERIAGSEYQVEWRGGRVVRILPAATGRAPYWWREIAGSSQGRETG